MNNTAGSLTDSDDKLDINREHNVLFQKIKKWLQSFNPAVYEKVINVIKIYKMENGKMLRKMKF